MSGKERKAELRFLSFRWQLPSLGNQLCPNTKCGLHSSSSCAQTELRPRWPRRSLSLNKHWALTPPSPTDSLIRPLSNKALSPYLHPPPSSSIPAPHSPGATETMGRQVCTCISCETQPTKQLLNKLKEGAWHCSHNGLLLLTPSSLSGGIADTGHTLPGPEPPSPSPSSSISPLLLLCNVPLLFPSSCQSQK